MEELKEKIAISLCLGMYGVPSREYNKLHDDSKEELRISAAAALRAIEEAGYAVVPKHALSISDPSHSCSSSLNLEEPRG